MLYSGESKRDSPSEEESMATMATTMRIMASDLNTCDITKELEVRGEMSMLGNVF